MTRRLKNWIHLLVSRDSIPAHWCALIGIELYLSCDLNSLLKCISRRQYKSHYYPTLYREDIEIHKLGNNFNKKMKAGDFSDYRIPLSDWHQTRNRCQLSLKSRSKPIRAQQWPGIECPPTYKYYQLSSRRVSSN